MISTETKERRYRKIRADPERVFRPRTYRQFVCTLRVRRNTITLVAFLRTLKNPYRWRNWIDQLVKDIVRLDEAVTCYSGRREPRAAVGASFSTAFEREKK